MNKNYLKLIKIQIFWLLRLNNLYKNKKIIILINKKCKLNIKKIKLRHSIFNLVKFILRKFKKFTSRIN